MNEERAVEWLQKAADQGDFWALGVLGDCYLHGKGVRQDQRRAKELYQTAAQGGDAHAKKALQELESAPPPASEKKSGGFFKRLFGK